MRLVTSKDITKVREFAKKTGRTMLWKDEFLFWHAAKDLNNVPKYATEKSKV